ncbi:MAG: (2Fe-2S)-binding protein [Porphyromonadaceae bacterium]|nr:(2Fe-2S)-binding protein [Porphyromonadaceae bacterium]
MGQADEIICHCLGITRGQIEEAVREKGLSTFDEVSDAIEAGSVCGSCQDDIEEIIAEIKG